MSNKGHRIVFLYSELAGYFLACAEALGDHPDVASVDIIHWPINPEAPFQFASTSQYTLHPKANFDKQSLKKLLDQINPTAIITSGWMDRDYNDLAKQYVRQIPVVLTLDNWWTGSLKQWIAVLTSPLIIHRRFNRAWVPGSPQKPFAEKLGFKGSLLATGFYCADSRPFEKIYERRQTTVPAKKILYVGRYVEFKGIVELWNAFAAISTDFPEWELHCIGTGDLWEERMIHPKIFHHGFKQPHELSEYLEDAACFVMPSKKEPWGVVLHEMAISGLPVLVSDQVGARTSFLENKKNGVSFKLEGLSETLRWFLSLTEESQNAMGKSSYEIGSRINTRTWCHEILRLLAA